MPNVLGIGNALVDVVTLLDSDQVLERFALPRGSMQLVDGSKSKEISEGTSHLKREIASGGSAANTIYGLARMGVESGFIGKTGRDEMGRLFKQDLENYGVKTYLLESDTPSGVAMALISPDSERTFATYLGAAVEMGPDDLDHNLFSRYKYLHIEGYLVQNHDLIEAACIAGKKAGMTLSIDMAAYNVVEANLDFLKHLVAKYIDIVFANEEEAKVFTGAMPEEALESIASMCSLAVVKIGREGSLIARGKERVKSGVIRVNSIDTTGAGDLYASGFLAGLLKGLPLEKCGYMGSVLAGKTIEVMGPRMPQEKWNEVFELTSGL
ncbi:MAG: adenosine kinase [Bacteroidales bacterium]